MDTSRRMWSEEQIKEMSGKLYRHNLSFSRTNAPSTNTLRCTIYSHSNTRITNIAKLREVMNAPTTAIYLPVSGSWLNDSIQIVHYLTVINNEIKLYGYDITNSAAKNAVIYETNIASDTITEL